jgi:hypothetical protein
MQRIATYAPHAARLALGLLFFVLGINGFLNFLPMPPHEGGAGAFLGALAATGYMFPLIKGTEVVAAIFLLSNRFVPLALVLLAPVIVNISMFHLLLEPALPLVATLLGLEFFLAWSYRAHFRSVLAPKATPELGGGASRSYSSHAGSIATV